MKISDARFLRHLLRKISAPYAFVLAITLLTYPVVLLADADKTLTACIPQHTAKDALLSQVASTISHHKADRNTGMRLPGVQLAGVDQILVTDNPFKGNQSNQTLSPELRDRAVLEHCDYVLVVSLPDVRTARSPQPNVPSPIHGRRRTRTILICAGKILTTMFE